MTKLSSCAYVVAVGRENLSLCHPEADPVFGAIEDHLISSGKTEPRVKPNRDTAILLYCRWIKCYGSNRDTTEQKLKMFIILTCFVLFFFPPKRVRHRFNRHNGLKLIFTFIRLAYDNENVLCIGANSAVHCFES